jgi:RHS repeat-associated protein
VVAGEVGPSLPPVRSSIAHEPGGSTEDSFYGYTPHTDVETLTTATGETRATYAYTAFGDEEEDGFTGVDAPDPADPDAEPYNVYRYTGKRFDPARGDYDMGFRDYDPGLNRFISRDSYNGDLADLNLAVSPWTGNRYAFAGGNPITGIELDGHRLIADGGGGGYRDTDLDEALVDHVVDHFTSTFSLSLEAANLVHGVIGGLAELHVDILKRHADVLFEEARVAGERYLKSGEVPAEARRYNNESWAKYLEGDRQLRETNSFARRIGSKLRVVGAGLTVAGIGVDIQQGKPAGKAIVSGVGGALAAAGTGRIAAASPISGGPAPRTRRTRVAAARPARPAGCPRLSPHHHSLRWRRAGRQGRRSAGCRPSVPVGLERGVAAWALS